MNNNEFDKLISKKYKASDATYKLIDSMSKPKSRNIPLLKWCFASLASIFISFAVLINMSTAFYLFAQETPFKDIANLLRIIEEKKVVARIVDIIEKEQYQKIDTSFIYNSENLGEVNINIIGSIYDSYSVTLIIEQVKKGGTIDSLESLMTMKINNVTNNSAYVWSVDDANNYYFMQFIFDEKIEANQVFEVLSSNGSTVCLATIDKEYVQESEIIIVNEVLGNEDKKVLVKNLVIGRLLAIIEYEDKSLDYQLVSIEFNKINDYISEFAFCDSGKCFYNFAGVELGSDVLIEFVNLVMAPNKKTIIKYDLAKNKWLDIPTDWKIETVTDSDGNVLEDIMPSSKGIPGLRMLELVNDIESVEVSVHHAWGKHNGERYIMFSAEIYNPKKLGGILIFEVTEHEYVKVDFSRVVK